MRRAGRGRHEFYSGHSRTEEAEIAWSNQAGLTSDVGRHDNAGRPGPVSVMGGVVKPARRAAGRLLHALAIIDTMPRTSSTKKSLLKALYNAGSRVGLPNKKAGGAA